MTIPKNNRKFTQKTIGQIINEITAKYPGNIALVSSDSNIRYTYQTFLSEINIAARGLIKIGIKKGDRVALCAPNSPEWIIYQMALAKIGAIVVPIDHGAEKEDLCFILEHSGSASIIMAEELELEIRVKSMLKNFIVIGENSYPDMTSSQGLMEMGHEINLKNLTARENEIGPDDPVAIMYTSGTTGKPKGVVLDHCGLVTKSIFSGLRQGLTASDRLCLFFPLFHMFGNTCILLAGLIKGASIIMPCADFEPAAILSAITTEKCTAIYGSPSMLITLINHSEFNPEQWKTLSKGTIGGAPCPIELMRKLVEEIGISDITVAYGITEASSWITMTKPNDPLESRVSTIGSALECNEVKILDPSTGEDLPSHHQGELCTRGFLMKEYYNMPAATASVIDKQGWFHTGDLGEMDENGYVKITGRLKDVIIRKGIEIYPTELEEIIYNMPGVSEVQIFGFPHPEKGQEVAAWIKVKEDALISSEDLKKYIKNTISKEKEPHYYKLVTEFPMTKSGKVQKFKLAEMAKKEYLDP